VGVASRQRGVPDSKVRLTDIAREAGVSTATVSRVINNLDNVSATLRRRVMEIVHRHNYYPNAQARSLASGRSNIIGLVISDIANPFFPELVKGMEATAYEHGYELILANTDYDPRRMSHYVRRFIERGVRGVALMTSEFDSDLVEELPRRDVSVVYFDGVTTGPRVSNLAVDFQRGIGEAVDHLVSLGHRRIAFISGPRHLHTSRRRVSAFRRSLRRHAAERNGQQVGDVYEGDFRLEGGRRAAREMLAERRHTAVLVANDMMALGVMQECRAAGLRIPRDISVIGLDDIALAALTEPPLTTVSLPRQTLGRTAVEVLLATIAHPKQLGVEIKIATSLVLRESTGPAPKLTSPPRRRARR
jgi:LacI family transcriptional regulator